MAGLILGQGIPLGAQTRPPLWLRVEERVALDSIPAEVLEIDPYGRVYLADRDNTICAFTWDMRLVKRIGGFGWGKEQFQLPIDLCAPNGLDVFVCDYYNHRVERYDKDLNYLASYRGEDLAESWRFRYPVSVDQAPQGDLFLLVRDPPSVIRLDALGQPRLAFGGLEAGANKLVDPIRLRIGGDGHVYVLDAGTRSLRVFDFFGNELGSLAEGELSKPEGLAWVPRDLLLVADARQGLLAIERGKVAPVALVPSARVHVRDVAFYRGTICLLVEARTVELWRGRLVQPTTE
ncbi:MAG: NHL repeat-containing protein [candidate division KSB1 bacterium]|nr:NHL repeat-containing protein [candidate division KSB1 bacterium]